MALIRNEKALPESALWLQPMVAAFEDEGVVV